MLLRKYPLAVINCFTFSALPANSLHSYNCAFKENAITFQSKFSFSNASQSYGKKQNKKSSTYMPIRPLKKNLTPLFVQKDFLNKGQISKNIPMWPFLTPFFAMCINNYLTTWSVFNSSVASLLFVLGFIVRIRPQQQRDHQILKFECNQDMSKFYMTIPHSFTIQNKYPQSLKPDPTWVVYTKQELTHGEYIPTEEQRKTLTEEEIQNKKKQFDDRLYAKIKAQRRTKKALQRLELDASKTMFKISDRCLDIIRDNDHVNAPIVHVEELLNAQVKYLIVRTEFTQTIRGKAMPLHFYMDLEKNGDPKYHDYLLGLGVNAEIVQNAESR